MNKLLNETETAERLTVSIPTLRRWRSDGVGPDYLKLVGCIRYRTEDIDAWVDASIRRETE